MTNDSFARWGVLIAMVIAIGFGSANLLALSHLSSAGGVYGDTSAGTPFKYGVSVGVTTRPTSGDLQIGASGSNFSNVIGTTCNLIGTDASQAASTSKAYDCAVTGLTSAYTAFAMLASTTPNNAAAGGTAGCPGWEIVADGASSTAGYLTVILANNSCAAAVPSATHVGSSTLVWAWKN